MAKGMASKMKGNLEAGFISLRSKGII